MDDEYYDYRSEAVPEPRYAPISTSKFILLYVFTFGLYSIVWFYRNWRYVKLTRDPDIWPIPRAVFSPLMYYPFLLELRYDEGKSLSGALALAWFVMLGTGNGSSIILLWVYFLSFLPLLPAVAAINDLNQDEGIPLPPAGRWRLRNTPVVLLGALAIVWTWGTYATTFLSNRVVAGDALLAGQLEHLRDVGLPSYDSVAYGDWMYRFTVDGTDTVGNIATADLGQPDVYSLGLACPEPHTVTFAIGERGTVWPGPNSYLPTVNVSIQFGDDEPSETMVWHYQPGEDWAMALNSSGANDLIHPWAKLLHDQETNHTRVRLRFRFEDWDVWRGRDFSLNGFNSAYRACTESPDT